MTDRDQTKQSELPRSSIMPIVVFVLARNILEIWLIRPLALGAAIAIVFPLMYPLGERQVTLARWLLFLVLFSLLIPGVIYGSAYLLCSYELGAVIYGLLVGALIFSMCYIIVSLEGEIFGISRWWILASLVIGAAAGIAFYAVPDVFCHDGVRGSD